MGSLWCAREFVGNDPFIYSHADIIYHPDILQSAAAEFATSDFDLSLVTDFCQTDEEMMKVAVTSDNFLLESHKAIAPHEAAGEWTGIAFVRSSDRLFGAMEKILAEEGLDYYDTRAFSLLARDGEKVFCSSTKDLPWTEIDFEADYKRACELFEES